MRTDVDALSDADLARSIRSAAPGEAAAAEGELYGRLSPRVRLYGLRHLRDAQASADLVQQVLLLTIEHLRDGKVRDPDRLSSYVLGMCRMVVLDLKRRRWRREQALRQFADDVATVEVSPPPSGETARVTECLAALSQRERSVLVLTFQAERSAVEVGRELGLTAANVRVIRHRALIRLRACFERTDAEE